MLILLSIIGGGIFVYNSKTFERDVPIVKFDGSGYWNLKDSLKLTLEDSSGIKEYKISIKTSSDEIVVGSQKVVDLKSNITLDIKAPSALHRLKDKTIELIVEAADGSRWNFFEGNKAEYRSKIVIDKRSPQVAVVTNSYAIIKGGSALVIFKAEDENIDEIFIETNGNKIFRPQKFYKDGYYISLIAWPLINGTFSAAIVVKDKAGNITKSHIPLYLKDKAYRLSKIALSDNFLDGKISELAEVFDQTQGVTDKIERFKIINEDVRAKNEILIHKITSKISDNMIDNFPIKPFYPLKNGAKVASFGDHRLFSYEGKQVSESYHMGLDLASVKMGEIKTQNPAVVVYASENGIYGLMPVLHHGLGLYTIYGHCSSTTIFVDDILKENSHFANTGKSGYAMGDHLHFGVLVQGVEVRPEEWMDKQWIDLNINDVITNGKKIIDSQH
jgi:murein DD-endopeptidase MepM/ murein hydrolase activator NlpD